MNRMDGGMMIPTVPPEAMVTAENSGSYPSSFIWGCMMAPMVAAVAAFEPDMAAKAPHAPSVAMPKPPRIQPRQAWAKAVSLRAMPAALIRSPVRINRGMASRAKAFNPSNSVTPKLARGMSMTRLIPTDHKPRTTRTGEPMRNRSTHTRLIRAIMTFLLHWAEACPAFRPEKSGCPQQGFARRGRKSAPSPPGLRR